MATPTASIKNVSITAQKHTYDGTIDGVIYHFVDNNSNQSVDKGDSLDFYFQLEQYNYPTCEDILKDKQLKASSLSCKGGDPKSPQCIAKAAISTCKKMGEKKYTHAIEKAAKSFLAGLEAELKAFKKGISGKEPVSKQSNLCNDDNEESTIIKKDNAQIADIDSNGTADEAIFDTTDGIGVNISVVELSCKPIKKEPVCCKELDASRTGVAEYLSILDPLFD